MFFFTQRNRVRTVAAKVLLGWVFALAAGIVNACLIEPHPRLEPVTSAQEHGGHHGHDGDAGPAAVSSKPSDETSAAKAACLKFCDAEFVSLPTGKPPSDPWQIALVALPPPLLQATLDPGQRERLDIAPLGPDGRHVPLIIAYLRLAL
jgi:hypothetical protein